MYEPARLPGTSIPLATPVTPHRNTDQDPVAMWNSYVGTLLTPKTYATTVKMIAGNPNAIAANPQGQPALPVLNALMLSNVAQSAETYAELIGETPVVQKVINNLHLQTDVRTLQGAVKVKPVTNTNIIALEVGWSDPATSAAIANEFANVFLQRERDLVSSQANGALATLSQQLPQARDRLNKAEQAVSRVEIAHNIADLTTQTP